MKAALFYLLIQMGLILAMALDKARGSELIAVDKAAHFGISYGITHASYAVCKKISNKKVPCLIGAAAFSTALGVTKELIDPSIGGNRDIKDLAADLLGTGFAVTFISIEF